MKEIRVEDAVGQVICHDITRIVKDEVKEVAFKKGHIVTEEDIPALLKVGKEHLFVWEKPEGALHENDAADRLYALCKNANIRPSEVKEGKIELFAETDGLFRVDVDRLNKINEIGEIIIATRHTNSPVHKGDKLAGLKVIPLVIDEKKLDRADEIAGDTPLVAIHPYLGLNAAVITTGSEVFHGRIQDTFTPVVIDKLRLYGIETVEHRLMDDDQAAITKAILECKEMGCNLICCTGGMSVDPDDKTPGAIKNTGANIISYGAPVFPGAMFLLGYFPDGVTVMGLPGCVMYAKATVFDLVLPRVAAGLPVSEKEIARMWHGGLCLGCPVCHYPDCGFGKSGD